MRANIKVTKASTGFTTAPSVTRDAKEWLRICVQDLQSIVKTPAEGSYEFNLRAVCIEKLELLSSMVNSTAQLSVGQQAHVADRVFLIGKQVMKDPFKDTEMEQSDLMEKLATFINSCRA